MITRLELVDWWNILDIIVLAIAIGMNLAYFIRHRNGKKWVRVFSAGVLLITLLLRSALALGYPLDEFRKVYLPWATLVYLLPALDAYVDWQIRGRK